MVSPFDIHGQKRVIGQAEEGTLPADFDQWPLRGRQKLAFTTFTYGKGPGPNFKEWDLRDDQGRTMAHSAALYNKLPAGFDQWTLADKGGWTVAHEFAYRHVLPADFPHWAIEDSRGQSVAHIAAQRGNLPPDFSRWELRTPQDSTVAHTAASMGHLPDNFDQWDLVDEKGVTVRDKFEARDEIEKYAVQGPAVGSRSAGPKM